MKDFTLYRRLRLAFIVNLAWLGVSEPMFAQERVPLAVYSELMAAAPSVGDLSIGSASARITVVEYTSILCPYCGAFHRETWPALKARYVDTGKVRWIVREFSIGNADFVAFVLGRCAGNVRALEIIDDLFHRQRDVFRANASSSNFLSFAKTLGFQPEVIEKCVADPAFMSIVEQSRRVAEDRFHVAGTPTFFLPGHAIVGESSIEEFSRALDASLEETKPR